MSATASPAGPDPITATVFPVLFAGGLAFTIPVSKAVSIIALSFSFILTQGPLIPHVHAD